MPYTAEQLNQMSDDELIALKAQLQEHKKTLTMPKFNMGNAIVGGLRGLTEGKIPTAEKADSSLEDFIMKEKLKKMLEGDPLENERKKLELKAEMEANDPYKQSQIKLNEAMLENIKGSAGGELVYRDTLTGEEVPRDIAINDISQGNNRYKVFRRSATRQGVKEDPVTEPQVMTSESAGLIGALPSMEGSVDKILSFVENPDFKWGALGDVRAATGNPYLVGGQLEQIQSELNNLKKTAFAEGGKQLTSTEKQIVFRALEPGGKDIGTWVGELKRAKEVLRNKARLMVKNPQMLNKGGAAGAIKSGGQVMVDAQGNKAIVYPDGRVEEIE